MRHQREEAEREHRHWEERNWNEQRERDLWARQQSWYR